ncbi:MAG: PQQ-dependent sugar dehydrogenase [Flavitalea sp.]
MKLYKVVSAAMAIAFAFISCQKIQSLEEKPAMFTESSGQTIPTAITAGTRHESFDRLPLDLSWEAQYKLNTNAFSISADKPKIGPGAAKFILYPDAVVGLKNRCQLNYFSYDSLGTESTYSFYVRIPNSWADRPANNDVMLASFNASPNPAKGETWNNIPITEPLIQFKYHAEGGKSVLQLWQGLNSVKAYEGKIWTQTMMSQTPITKESWFKISIRIKWSVNNDGYVYATINDQSWTSRTAVRTMSNFIPAFFKIGLSRNTPANVPENVISAFFDDVTISSTGPNRINSKVIAQNLTNPWDLAWGADNYVYFTERLGSISRINLSTNAVTKLITLTDVGVRATGGLLGMTLHPQFPQQPYLYATYYYNKGGKGKYTQKVVRFTLSANKLINPFVVIDNISSGVPTHHGSRLLISNNFLYITTGDGGGGADGKSAQDLHSLIGKVLRINLDGTIPSSNPIAGSPIWSWGFRNSQGLAFANNRIYSSEHGPDNDDEINIIEKGRNYGWPTVMGYCDNATETNFCSVNNVRQPIKAWTPTIAPCGLEYYPSAGSITQWRGSLLLCTLKNERLMQLKLSSDGSAITETKEYFTNTYGRLRDICVSPKGTVYVCTDNDTNDKIIEISAQ